MTPLEEIKKALEGVTPGPWFDWETNEWLVDPQRLLRRYLDASFIAHCDPVAISELLSTLESLQRENAALKIDASKHAADAETVRREREVERRRAEAAEAQVKRLHELLRFAHDTLWEINPSNYDHDDVCKLNDASVEVILAIAPELGETHGKSKEWWEERQSLASTGGEHNGN
ncbi:hypothetical protein G6M16_008925 [Agrobacterium tumefaciens]|nr:hypothetical protein G6M16_008925 [Agrobacterium tumefaciens]